MEKTTYQDWLGTTTGSESVIEVYKKMATCQPTKFELDKEVRHEYNMWKEKYAAGS